MNLRQQAQKQGPLQIGRYQSWLENGKLKIYSHQFGKATGVSCTFSPEETRALLEMLTNHINDIDSALHRRERNYSLD